MCLFCSASSTLVTPATPAAAVVCPMLVLMEPSAQECRSAPDSRKAFASAWNSMGSPSLVAVPCASMNWIFRASMPNDSYTSRMSRSCETALGAVMPLVVPSWLIPEPRITP